MSYSRWSNSYWYTYWMVTENETYDTATFCICRFEENITFTAKALREKFDKCLDKVKIKERQADTEEFDELAIYMHRFLKDVDAEYLNK